MLCVIVVRFAHKSGIEVVLWNRLSLRCCCNARRVEQLRAADKRKHLIPLVSSGPGIGRQGDSILIVRISFTFAKRNCLDSTEVADDHFASTAVTPSWMSPSIRVSMDARAFVDLELKLGLWGPSRPAHATDPSFCAGNRQSALRESTFNPTMSINHRYLGLVSGLLPEAYVRPSNEMAAAVIASVGTTQRQGGGSEEPSAPTSENPLAWTSLSPPAPYDGTLSSLPLLSANDVSAKVRTCWTVIGFVSKIAFVYSPIYGTLWPPPIDDSGIYAHSNV